MSRTIYALLVGINDYLGGVPGLNGCVNDVKRMGEFLQLRTQGGEFALRSLVLTSGDYKDQDEVKPTRKAVIAGFRTHLCQAGPDDVAFFFYSGHGSQEKAPPELWHLEPDHLDETIVCYDSRTAGSWDLADKELALLIAEVAQKSPHILVILDACHSGSGTRAADATDIRLAPCDRRERPLSAFEGFQEIQQQRRLEPGTATAGDWLSLPEGKHVVISACRAEQVAGERFLGDGVHGLLSYYLLDTLQHTGTGLTYRDTFARVSALVCSQATQQNPVIETSDVRQLQEPFLGGAVRPQPPYYSLTYRQPKGWLIDGGAVHGIPAPVGDETTTLAVFEAEADLAAVRSLRDALGLARVTAVAPGESQVEFSLKSGDQPDRVQAFKALVVSQPLPPVAVRLRGDEQGLGLVRAALAVAGLDQQPSLIVRELVPQDIEAAAQTAHRAIPADQMAPLTLTAADGRYLIRRTSDAYPLMVPVESGYTALAASLAVRRLEHVARWLQVAQLENKSSALPADAVAMELYAIRPDGSLGERIDATGDIRLSYTWQDSRWVQPRLKLKLVNHTDRRLYCMLLDLTETFGVSTAGLLKGGGEWLDPEGQPQSEVWAYQGKPIAAGITKALHDRGVLAFRDIVKLIVSTAESNATLLERDDLDVATRGTTGVVEKAIPKSPLNRLMSRVQTRGIGDRAEDDEAITDWMTSQITLTTVWPAERLAVPSVGAVAVLSENVSIEGHPSLQAYARLTSLAEGSRDAGNLALPAFLRNNPQMARPFEFSASRSGEPGLSALELQVLGDSYKTVTAESPLVLRVAKPIATNEYVLPVAFDPQAELFLPLGRCERRADSTVLLLDRLPNPVSSGRDVVGSIKLFFQKVIAEKLGLEGQTTRLAVATVTHEGRVEYDESPLSVAKQVKQARRILLCIHGFVGDTRQMVVTLYGLLAASSPLPLLAERYDLILAFDYENINTPIEETALRLKEQLLAVGLGPGHRKTLHVVAHSMGCMVARWFIEREGGNKIVRKAILAGPPNAGTPWAKLEDLALVGLGAALNGLAALAWPPSVIPTLIGVLSALVASVEKVDVTADELKPGSAFYKLLNASSNPRVPYGIIAGNTSRIRQAQVPQGSSEKALLEKLVELLTSAETRYAILSLAFLGQPNDYAISVASMSSLPPGRSPAPVVREIACDHASYFTTEVGLRALGEALLG